MVRGHLPGMVWSIGGDPACVFPCAGGRQPNLLRHHMDHIAARSTFVCNSVHAVDLASLGENILKLNPSGQSFNRVKSVFPWRKSL